MSYRCSSRGNRSGVQQSKGKKRSVITALVGALLGGLGLAAQAQVPSNDYFPIGVHAQPKGSFDKWVGRGVNTLFQYEGENNSQGLPSVPMDVWSSTAASKGLYYVRTPSANPADDLQEKYLLAWAQKDEPDLSNHSPNPAVNIDIYQNWKAIGPSKPVWINFAGPNVTQGGANYTQWDKAGDWIAVDWYPINWGRFNNINFIGQSIDKLRNDSGGVPKKYMAYIETSYQRIKAEGRAPTKDEFRGEVWSAIMHGANGIIYFPQVVPTGVVGGSFSYDGTPTDVAAEMTTQDSLIQSYGRVLNSTRNPSSRSLSASSTAIEATWRVMQEGDYFFVLNQSPNSLTGVTLNLAGLASSAPLAVMGENRTESLIGSAIVDDFSPYQLHIYKAAALGGSPAVPEPAAVGTLGLALVGLAMRRSKR